MLTETGIEKFNIDKFIEGCLDLDWLDIHLRCQNMEVWAESITTAAKDPEYIIKERARISFIRFIEEFCFIISRNNIIRKPPGMSNINFFKIKPIIEKLVASGELDKAWLPLYKKPD